MPDSTMPPPLAVGLRWYFNDENQFPSSWPRPFSRHAHDTFAPAES
jgi:hypothetical protein